MSDSIYYYSLPPSLIAQFPASPRDSSRLMVINKTTGELSHHVFRNLPDLLKPTDVLVFNNTKVFPARLHGTKNTGGNVDVLLLKEIEKEHWEALLKSFPNEYQRKIKLYALDSTVDYLKIAWKIK